MILQTFSHELPLTLSCPLHQYFPFFFLTLIISGLPYINSQCSSSIFRSQSYGCSTSNIITPSSLTTCNYSPIKFSLNLNNQIPLVLPKWPLFLIFNLLASVSLLYIHSLYWQWRRILSKKKFSESISRILPASSGTIERKVLDVSLTTATIYTISTQDTVGTWQVSTSTSTV